MDMKLNENLKVRHFGTKPHDYFINSLSSFLGTCPLLGKKKEKSHHLVISI